MKAWLKGAPQFLTLFAVVLATAIAVHKRDDLQESRDVIPPDRDRMQAQRGIALDRFGHAIDMLLAFVPLRVAVLEHTRP